MISERVAVISNLAAYVNQFLDRTTDSFTILQDAIAPASRVTLQEEPDGRFLPVGSRILEKHTSRRVPNMTIIFDPSHFLVLDLALPSGAKPYLQGVITSQIDRISPWTSEQAIFGSTILNERQNSLQVRVAIAARDSIAKQISNVDLNAIRSLSLRVPTKLDGLHADVDIPYENRLHKVPSPERRVFAAIFFGAIALAFGVQLFSMVTNSAIERSLSQVQAEISTLRETMSGSGSGKDQKANPLSRMILLKTNQFPTVELLNSLAAAIPDHTYLTALEYVPTRLHIEGNSTHVTELPKAIATQQAFGEVIFSAPTAKRRDGDGESFQVDIVIPSKQGSTP